jgi:hypothetical protein
MWSIYPISHGRHVILPPVHNSSDASDFALHPGRLHANDRAWNRCALLIDDAAAGRFHPSSFIVYVRLYSVNVDARTGQRFPLLLVRAASKAAALKTAALRI